jgi:hypothetical protein
VGFYIKLLEDDDWSFTIKLHSLIETAISFALSESIKIAFNKYYPEGNIDLLRAFTLMETSNKNTGKLAFLKGLDIPHSNYRGFIMHLSQMRNKMIHNISNVGMSIKEYYDSLVTDKDDFRDKMTFTIDGDTSYKDKKLNKNQLFDLYPKVAIWYVSLECILELYSVVRIFDAEKKTDESKEQIAKIHADFYEKFSPIISEYINSKNT